MPQRCRGQVARNEGGPGARVQAVRFELMRLVRPSRSRSVIGLCQQAREEPPFGVARTVSMLIGSGAPIRVALGAEVERICRRERGGSRILVRAPP